ncbi:MAG TPA: cytochrome ubiquinol oxidase subunit I [Rhodospirillaceae bacterium]|nr:cytochrome ubiquinol oxidase subunit I [Rhodospirillaceae bacterium]
MPEIDPFMLARIQFAANITFHILFPTITIALGWVLLFFKLRFNATQDPKWMDLYMLFTKVFALSFALGVVSGITMSFQFGTNWPGFMLTVGNIAGPLLAYEVLTAFFLEATFLGIMLFGASRVPNWVHNLATIMVAGGTTLSAFWILVLNSWMQTPVGFEMIDGQAHATDWLAILFNPSMPYRLTHMLLASGLTAAFLVAGLCAFRWFVGQHSEAVKTGMRVGVTLAAILIPIQIFVGDLHGLNTLEHQPQKVAAMEGLWETQKGAPLVLFGMPNEKTRSNDYAVEVPKLASLILTHDADGELKGLNEFAGNHPPVVPVFWAFRIMVGVGVLMLLVSWAGAFMLRQNRDPAKILTITLIAMTFMGWLATLAGWYVTEIGRQPWLVYGVLATKDAVAAIPSPILGISLTMYLLVYVGLIITYVATLFHLARHADKPKDESGKATEGERSAAIMAKE